MRLSLNTGPAVEPVSLTDMKTYLKVDESITDDDELITSLIQSARIMAEEWTRMAFITQTWDMYLDKAKRKIELFRPPLQSISSFNWYNEDYDESTVSSSLYIVKTFKNAEPGYILLKSTETWPTYTSNGDGLKITYVAGYGDTADDVPENIKTAIKQTVAHWYENRESQELPPEAIRILDKYKIVML